MRLDSNFALSSQESCWEPTRQVKLRSGINTNTKCQMFKDNAKIILIKSLHPWSTCGETALSGVALH